VFAGKETARLSVLQQWVLEQGVTEIEMNERQFWNFVSVQPIAERPWTTYMGGCCMSATCRWIPRSGSSCSTNGRPAPSRVAILTVRSQFLVVMPAKAGTQ
jgi:hypothetical protein